MRQNVLYPNQAAAAEPQLHFCFKCRWEGRISQTVCPRCGKPLFSEKNIRVRGVILTFLGLFLSGFMSAIAFFVTAMLMQASKNPKTSAKLNGDEHMLIMIYLIFAGVIAMGVTIMLAGIWQIIFGRRNLFLIWIFLTLIGLTFLVGGIFRAFAD
jgi:MFS family permease